MIKKTIRWRANIHAKNQHAGGEPKGQEYCTYTVGEFDTHTAACERIARLDIAPIGVLGITVSPVEDDSGDDLKSAR